MSSSSHKPHWWPRAAWSLLGGLALGVPAAQAQDFYFVPDVSLSVEHHDNLELNINPAADASTEGYVGNLAGTLGWRSQRGLTEIRPRLQLQQYPDRDDLAGSNQYLDLRSLYSTLKGQWELTGRFDRRDEYNAQISEAGFDAFDPDDPIVDQSGRVLLLSEQRTRVQLRPEYTHRFTERFGAGVSAVYQRVNFEVDGVASRTDYDYKQLDAGLLWGFGPLTELTTGVYAAQYQAADDSNTTDSVGAEFQVEHRWSQTIRGTAALRFENTEVDESGFIDKDTSWGFTFGLVSRGEISQFRATAGRDFTPSGSGSRSQIDEIRLQYERNFTQRWRLISALRGFRTEAQGLQSSRANDRDYARGEFELRWRMTPTWYIGGGYTYTWQEYELAAAGQSDNIYMLKVGYVGLPPQ